MILDMSVSIEQSTMSSAMMSAILLRLITARAVTTSVSSTLPSFSRPEASAGTSKAGLMSDMHTWGHHRERFLSTVTVPKGFAIVQAGAGDFFDLGLFHVGSALTRTYAAK